MKPAAPEQIPGRWRVFAASWEPWLGAVLTGAEHAVTLSGEVRRLTGAATGSAQSNLVPGAWTGRDDPPFLELGEPFDTGSGPCHRVFSVSDCGDDGPLGSCLAKDLVFEIPRPDLGLVISLSVHWIDGEADERLVLDAADDFARHFVMLESEAR